MKVARAVNYLIGLAISVTILLVMWSEHRSELLLVWAEVKSMMSEIKMPEWPARVPRRVIAQINGWEE